MSTEDNIRVVRSAYEAFQRGDIDGVLSSFDRDVTWFTPGPPEVPYAGARRGREEVGRFFAQLDATLEFLDFAPEEFLGTGDTVIVIGRDRVRVKGASDVIEERWAHVMKVRDGRVVDFREFMDTAELVAALRKVSVSS